MKKNYLFSFICCFFLSFSLLAQEEYLMMNNFVTDCEGILFDSGGFFDDYGDDEDFTFTICPDNPPTCLQMEFQESNIESGSDFISFFDGPDVNSELIGTYTGEIPAMIGASSGCMTIRFTSNGFTELSGWIATWECSNEACQSPPPPVPSPQDCINAIPICQDVYFEMDAYQGVGNIPDEINPDLSCLFSGEKNDVWYVFTVQEGGDLAFTITPNVLSDDYDWAVFNLTTNPCSDINNDISLQVSCNYSGDTGETGPTGATTETNAGAGGPNQNATIPVEVGETYVINVSQFSTSINGYTIDFSSSTAEIFDLSPPEVTNVVLPSECGGQTVAISLSENVICDDITPESFVIDGPGGPYTITTVLGQACAIGGEYDNAFELQIDPPLSTSGTFSFSTDLLFNDLCGNQSSPIEPMMFSLECQAVLGSIGGIVWLDVNGNGMLDGEEVGLEGIVVNLYAEDGMTLIATVLTDSSGFYTFGDLVEGTYVVIVGSGPENTLLSTQSAYSYELGESSTETGANFGYEPVVCSANVGTLDESSLQDFYCSDSPSFSFSSTGFEGSADYVQVYVLTQSNDDLTIVDVNTTGIFNNPGTGSYVPHALNVLAEEAPANLGELVGQSAVLVLMTLDCYDLVSGSAFVVLSPINVSVDYECDAEAGLYTLAVSFSGGMPAYAVANGLPNADDYIYSVSGDVSGDYEIGSADILIESSDNSSYSFSVEDNQGCSDTESGTPAPCIKVAIELLDFYGRSTSTGNRLYWSTASENNAAFFLVERSLDGEKFEQIGMVKATGNSNTLQKYSFVDKDAPLGLTYYRLQEEDTDGQLTPSPIISLNRVNEEVVILDISPIPARNFIELQFNTVLEQMPSIQLYDEAGRLVQILANDVVLVDDKMQLIMQDLPKGIYFLSIQIGEQVMNEKFVKQ